MSIVEHCTVRRYGAHSTKASIFHFFFSSLITQYKSFLLNKLQQQWEGGKGKNWKDKKEEEEEEEGKRQVANRDRENERERERESPGWVKMSMQLCGGLGGAAHQQNFWLFNFSTATYN